MRRARDVEVRREVLRVKRREKPVDAVNYRVLSRSPSFRLSPVIEFVVVHDQSPS
jgi:hypothetical protein